MHKETEEKEIQEFINMLQKSDEKLGEYITKTEGDGFEKKIKQIFELPAGVEKAKI